MKELRLALEDDRHRDLLAYAQASKQNMSAVVDAALEEYLATRVTHGSLGTTIVIPPSPVGAA